MDLFTKCRATVQEVERARKLGIYPYFTPIESAQSNHVIIDGREFIMIGSNGYLGLAADPRLKQAAIEAVQQYGSTCSGSRFLNGTLDLHVKLEQELASFFGRDRALAFSTGFQTNLGIISSLAGKDDVIIIDRQVHASIIDGCRLSFAEVKKYRHNDLDDLERILKGIPADQGKLIIVDGVFSMEGEVVELPRVVELKKRYGARLLVDDAHGIGVLGEHGRGVCEHFGLISDVDLIMGTFSKAFASLGGFVVGDDEVIQHIQHTARSLIFSASMTPAAAASARKSLEIIQCEPERRERLWRITERVRDGFKNLGFDTGRSTTPVIPVIIGQDDACFAFWKCLYDQGVFANPVISPATPPGRALIRTSYMATHTDGDVTRVIEVFRDAARRTHLIK